MNLFQEIEQWTPAGKAIGAMILLITFVILLFTLFYDEQVGEDDGR